MAGCSARPGPAPTVDPSEAAPTLDQGQDNLSSANLDNRRSQLTIGIDPVDSGFNPHLAANDYSFVQSLAALVFPSAFVQGQLNTDLLVSAEEIPPAEGAAQTIRYVINPDAQWNDGTPISYADFYYLWDSMRDNPDVINGAGYRAIKAMRTSDGGKKIEIDFDQRIRDWNELFDNILPAHLLKDATGGFDGALKTSIPASGGRYAVKDIDFARGIYTIVRNDRFWGNNPAATEVLQFREIRSVTQGVEMLRSGQLNFVDASPTETAELSYDLIPDAQVRVWDRNSTLTIDFNTASTRMPTPELRKQLAGLIDTEQLAILATGRRTNIAAIPKTINNDAAGNDSTADELRALSNDTPLVIAADPADATSTSAATALVDMLAGKGVKAEVKLVELADIARNLAPQGRIDATISWHRTPTTSLLLASAYGCSTAPTSTKETEDQSDSTTTATTTSTTPNTPRTQPGRYTPQAANLTQFCNPEINDALDHVIAGESDFEETKALAQRYNQEQTLTLPILNDRRLDVLGRNIQGPKPELEQWPIIQPAGVLPTAATWKSTR